MATSKNLERVCAIVLIVSLLASAGLVYVKANGGESTGQTMGYERRLFDTSRVHTIDIVMDDWDSFIENCESEEYSACAVVIDGESYKNVAICGCLALMNDFGTAIIFFVAFLVIAFLRSGDVATIALACAGTGFAGVLALRFKPYALKRFSAWGHVWENALTTGYSQTRAMMCIASGGLFGLGAGKGWLHNVGAADTDLVFALVSEEWGLILAVTLVAAIAVLAVFVVRSAPVGRSCFYTIGACAAVTILVTQAILNVFGTVDILPLIGVTFPFVSNGGSSMLCVWGLLAFVKAADTRQNASFAIRLPGRKGA